MAMTFSELYGFYKYTLEKGEFEIHHIYCVSIIHSDHLGGGEIGKKYEMLKGDSSTPLQSDKFKRELPSGYL